ncbi:hypothetical protein NA56DRAFT_704393 [Hyaloscypha hepaticicola]|uniref:Uncharacterized protein n=1 Tax=Hyaloscypha hepaticicola TaxID=2082293 RepID=A0A2J6Q2S5_9HELO|nr:hypothetical protein NA56DRAFT_704393 [Hyaloscypha hepaticicola]
MSTHDNGSHESGNNRENHGYTSLLDANGSFGSAFWHHESTNYASLSDTEDAWSTTANASTSDENTTGGDEKAMDESEKSKKSKRMG